MRDIMALETMDLALELRIQVFQHFEQEWCWRGRASGGGARLAWLAMQDGKGRLV